MICLVYCWIVEIRELGTWRWAHQPSFQYSSLASLENILLLVAKVILNAAVAIHVLTENSGLSSILEYFAILHRVVLHFNFVNILSSLFRTIPRLDCNEMPAQKLFKSTQVIICWQAQRLKAFWVSVYLNQHGTFKQCCPLLNNEHASFWGLVFF